MIRVQVTNNESVRRLEAMLSNNGVYLVTVHNRQIVKAQRVPKEEVLVGDAGPAEPETAEAEPEPAVEAGPVAGRRRQTLKQ